MSNKKFDIDGFWVDENNNVSANGDISSVGGTIATTGRISAGEVFGKEIQSENAEYGGDGALDETVSTHLMSAAFLSVDLTSVAPITDSIVLLHCADATNSCTVTLSSGTWDGTNTVATFSTESGLICYGGASRYYIVGKQGTVTFS